VGPSKAKDGLVELSRCDIKEIGAMVWTILLDALGEGLKLWGHDVEQPLKAHLALHCLTCFRV
jgi:hypothetical protein